MPLISICIPAYKRISFLKRLLDSIAVQTFRDFEVIVTDDSPDVEVESFCKQYQDQFQLFYHKNPVQLGTPENWNESIKRAKGEWIKLMHDDDWFATENSLEVFSRAIKNHPGKQFIFSGFRNKYEDGLKQDVKLNLRKHLYLKEPFRLISENVIGPPSVTLYKNKPDVIYDSRLKWLVDIDFYIRYLRSCDFYYINEVLVDIGISSEQVTQSSFRVASIEIPEHFLLLEKYGDQILRRIIVFDAFWRLMRNLNIKHVDDVVSAGFDKRIPDQIVYVIRFQRKVSNSILRIGIISKVLMMICYLRLYYIRKSGKV